MTVEKLIRYYLKAWRFFIDTVALWAVVLMLIMGLGSFIYIGLSGLPGFGFSAFGFVLFLLGGLWADWYMSRRD